MTALLAVDKLSKAYGGVRALSGVSFSLGSGEIVALIGPNGAGKSTCFKALTGQEKPDTGRVFVGGTETTGLPPPSVCRLGVGRTFQVAETFASMTVRENVQVALLAHHRRLARVYGYAGASFRERAEQLLDAAGLGEKASHSASELAYGDVKRLEFAMALAGEPKLLLMDEPAAGMGPRERSQLMALVAGLAKERGMGVLFTEHDMDIVFGHADRVLVLDRGVLIAEGTGTEIRNNPAVREVYLGSTGGIANRGAQP